MGRVEPMRIAQDAVSSPLLRSLVVEARGAVPSASELGRLGARIDAAIAAGVPAPDIGPIPPPGGASGLAVGKAAALIGAGLIVAAGVVGAGWWVARAPALPPQAPALSAAPSVPVMVPNTPSELSSATPAPPEEAPAASAPQGDGQGKPRGAANRQSEAALLDAARASLATNPRRALVLTEEHARRFPKGALVQEREVIAIQALEKLGNAEQAERRGNDFERRYPGSVHQPKIDQTTRGR